MRLRPSRLTRTDTLVPYTTLVRSASTWVLAGRGMAKRTMSPRRSHVPCRSSGCGSSARQPSKRVRDASEIAPSPALSATEITAFSGTHTLSVQASQLATPDNVKRSEEYTSELQSQMRISYAVYCLNKKKQ